MHTQSRPSMPYIDARSFTVPMSRPNRPSSSSGARRTGGHGKRRTVRRKPAWQFPLELLILMIAIVSLMWWFVQS